MPVTPICSICCEHYTPDCIIKTTKCGHIFHRQCILRWLRNTPNCPECRRFGPVLYRVYLNFSDSTETVNTEENVSENVQQQIESLIMKLSLEEEKNKSAEKRILELERKLREQASVARAKDEEHQKALSSFKERITKDSLENVRKSRQAAEEAEKVLKQELIAIKLKQQKPTLSVNHVSRASNSSTTIKLSTSNTCAYHSGGGSRMHSTSSTPTTTSSWSATSFILSTPTTTSIARNHRIGLPTTSRLRSSSSRRNATENISLQCHISDEI